MKRITAEQILLLHTQYLAETGGADGMRNPQAILSLTEFPFQTIFGEELYPTLFEKAAVYTRSMIMNHPFFDGNKRTGMAVGIIFLQDNGYRFNGASGSIEKFAVKVVVEKLDIAVIAKWFKMNTHKKLP